jgi:hypothetical protein
LNFLDEEGDDTVRAATNFFRLNQNIKPTV